MPLLYHPSSFCDICYDQYSDTIEPYVIGCGHVFCKKCLESIPSQGPARGAILSNPVCPTCRKIFWHNKIRRLYVDKFADEEQPEDRPAREQARQELELLDRLLRDWDDDGEEMPAELVAEIEDWAAARAAEEDAPVVQRMAAVLRKYKKVRKRGKQDRHEVRRLRDRLERHDVRHQHDAELATGVERSLQEKLLQVQRQLLEQEIQVWTLQIELARHALGPSPGTPEFMHEDHWSHHVPHLRDEPALPIVPVTTGSPPVPYNPPRAPSAQSSTTNVHRQSPAASAPSRASVPSQASVPPQTSAPTSAYAPSLTYAPSSRYTPSIYSTHNPLPPPPEPVSFEQYRGFTPAALHVRPVTPPSPPASLQTAGSAPPQTASSVPLQTASSVRSRRDSMPAPPQPHDGIIPGASPSSRVLPVGVQSGAPEAAHRAPAEASRRPTADASHRTPRRHRMSRSEAASTIPHQPSPQYAWAPQDAAALHEAATALHEATVLPMLGAGGGRATRTPGSYATRTPGGYAPPTPGSYAQPTTPAAPAPYPPVMYVPPMMASTSQRRLDSSNFLLPAAMQGELSAHGFPASLEGTGGAEAYATGYMPSEEYMNAYMSSYDAAYVAGYQRAAERVTSVADGGERASRRHRRHHRNSEPAAPTRAREAYAQAQPMQPATSSDDASRTPTMPPVPLSSTAATAGPSHAPPPTLRRSGTTGHADARRPLTTADKDARRRELLSQTAEERARRAHADRASAASSWSGTAPSVLSQPSPNSVVSGVGLRNFPLAPPTPLGEVPAADPHIPPPVVGGGSPPLGLLSSPVSSPPRMPRVEPRALSRSTAASATPRVWSAQSRGSSAHSGSRGAGLGNLLGLSEMETITSAAPLSMPTPRQPAPAFLRTLSESYSS
ncbi:hypothetical protein HDZ31DRAFT_35325 [Schizophyllum fasciatum]